MSLSGAFSKEDYTHSTSSKSVVVVNGGDNEKEAESIYHEIQSEFGQA